MIKMQGKPNLWQVLLSVLGAFLGVQSSRVQERDFLHGQPWWIYALVAVMLVLILIAILISVAKWMIQSTVPT